MMTIILTALATLFVTVLAGLALDYIRHGRPKVSYAIKDAVPIELQGKHIGAYLVSLDNVSKTVVRDLTCHIQAQPAKLRNGGITAPQGLQYSVSDIENGLQIAIPYLNKGDSLLMTVIAESASYVPKTPDVALRSPHEELIVVTSQSGTVPTSFKWGFLTAAVVATLVSGAATFTFTSIGTFRSQRDVLPSLHQWLAYLDLLSLMHSRQILSTTSKAISCTPWPQHRMIARRSKSTGS